MGERQEIGSQLEGLIGAIREDFEARHAAREAVAKIWGVEVERVFWDFVVDAMMLDLTEAEGSEPGEPCDCVIDDVVLDMG